MLPNLTLFKRRQSSQFEFCTNVMICLSSLTLSQNDYHPKINWLRTLLKAFVLIIDLRFCFLRLLKHFDTANNNGNSRKTDRMEDKVLIINPIKTSLLLLD